ncbi:hypothetical protein BpHYR1_049434 [Brachionus plicatilis]|uniref:Uncharacterized protein n=1 Tax=Brachionus plicatilis TaxID=10195 RepID=A0A3M7R2G7_BRAPC|nr:hypothetical protein BpHYR1_049434 [Brachionus plicatilis]
MCKRRSSCCCVPFVPLLPPPPPVPLVPLMPTLSVAPLMHGLPFATPFGLHGKKPYWFILVLYGSLFFL